MSARIKVGLISRSFQGEAYFETCARLDALELVACSDNYDPLDIGILGQRFGIPVVDTNALLADPEIELVINATHTKAHAAFALAALAAGKSVYNRPPFVAEPSEGPRILEFANEKGLWVGSDPDTFLGDGVQHCRKLIAEGAIGQPISATAFMVERSAQGWHPNPDFYYPHAAGAMYQLGPYCLATLIELLGRVVRVTGSQAIRPIDKPDWLTKQIVQETLPTHVAGLLEFANGVVATIVTNFDQGNHSDSRVEIYGTRGTLRLPDPMSYDADVQLRKIGQQGWIPVNVPASQRPQRHGLGLADMLEAIRSHRTPRASGALATHEIDIVRSIQNSAKLGKPVSINLSKGAF